MLRARAGSWGRRSRSKPKLSIFTKRGAFLSTATDPGDWKPGDWKLTPVRVKATDQPGIADKTCHLHTENMFAQYVLATVLIGFPSRTFTHACRVGLLAIAKTELSASKPGTGNMSPL